MQPKRIGFYPVCARDYLEPLRLLKGWVDELVFCDIKCMPRSSKDLECLRKASEFEGLPSATILVGDALTALQIFKPVHVFFLRRDSDGEGGSELHLLGPDRLPSVVEMILPGGLVVTDRANGRGWFDDFRGGRRNPYRVAKREISLSDQQPWTEHDLLSFTVN